MYMEWFPWRIQDLVGANFSFPLYLDRLRHSSSPSLIYLFIIEIVQNVHKISKNYYVQTTSTN